MNRTPFSFIALLGLTTVFASLASRADNGNTAAVVASSSAAAPAGHVAGGIAAAQPQGHGYLSAPGRAGPISPVPQLRVAPYPPSEWHSGYWYYGDHEHRSGWWWIAGGIWFWYTVPIYPYPDPYVPPTVILPAPPVRYWYWCDQPSGYYPYVSQCALPWRLIPATPPPPPPPPQ